MKRFVLQKYLFTDITLKTRLRTKSTRKSVMLLLVPLPSQAMLTSLPLWTLITCWHYQTLAQVCNGSKSKTHYPGDFLPKFYQRFYYFYSSTHFMLQTCCKGIRLSKTNIHISRRKETLTFDLTARMILGRATIRHFNAMVRYFSTKSAIPTIHIRSKKSSLSRLGFRNIRLKGMTTRLKYQWEEPHLSFLIPAVSTAGQRKPRNSTELQWSSQGQ